MLRRSRIFMDEAKPDTASSGNGATNATTAKTPDAPAQAAGNSGDPAAAQAQSTQQTPPTGDKGKEGQAADVSGYGGKPADTPAPAAGTEATTTDDKPLELDLKGFKEEEVQDLRDFAKTHKLSKETAQALLDQRQAQKAGDEQKRTEIQEGIKKQHGEWEKELRADPDFGGDKFDQSVHQVNKLITDHFPSIQKNLTKSGGKVPPDVMRDLRKVALKMYGESEFTEGSKPAAQTSKEREPWEYYGKEQNGL